MKLPSSTVFSLLPLLLLLLLLSTISAASDLVEQTCTDSSKGNPNINYDFCVNALQSGQADNCDNLNCIGLVSLTVLKDNVMNTTSLVQGLLNDDSQEAMDRSTRLALNDCLELYSDSISTINGATKNYMAHWLIDANIKVSAVMDAATTCEDGFEELGVVSPLSEQNSCTFQLCAVALSIMKMSSVDYSSVV